MAEAPSRLESLRQEFDGAFALPPRELGAAKLEMLGLRLGGHPYALSLTEIKSLRQGKTLLRLQSKQAAFLGLAGEHGALWPVWDLAQLCGYEAPKRPAWLVLVNTETPWAAAFESFDGYFQIAPDALSPLSGGAASSFAREVCTYQGQMRPLLRLALVLETIKKIMPSR